MKRLNEIMVAVLMVLSVIIIPAGAAIQGQTANETAGEKGYLDLSRGTVSWNPQNFAGFFYWPDHEIGNEKLTILDSDLLIGTRTIQPDKLVYRTSGENKMLNVVMYPFNRNYTAAELAGLEQFQAGSMSPESGSYNIVGWQGENFVAVKNKTNKLSKLLIEQGISVREKKTLTVGETWDIGGGWSLIALAIDAKANPRQVWFELRKDGIKKDDRVLSDHRIYTYVEKYLGGETDVPVFVTYIDAIFAGATSDMVQLRYTWVIDTNVNVINPGDRFGIFNTTVADESGITLKNLYPVLLEKNSIANLTGNYAFKVADSNTLRFYLTADSLSITGIRGQIANESRGVKGNLDLSSGTVSWNPQNFAGFFYDLDNGIGSDNLTVLHSDSLMGTRTILPKNLTYSVSGENKMLNVVKYPFNGDYGLAKHAGLGGFDAGSMSSENGSFLFVWWQMEKYAGVLNQTNLLARLLIEQGPAASDKKTLTVGESWEIGEGLVLTVNSIDAKANPRQVWVTLTRDGVKIDDRVLNEKEIYTYLEKTGAGIPVFVTYVDSIFAGATTDLVQFRYTWAMSSSFMSVKPGDRFGKFNTTIADASHIVLENTVPISLARGIVTDIFNNVKFRVVDSDILRFYPVTGIPQNTPPVCNKSLVMGYEFRDDNVDGLWDVSETGLGNWTVRLSGKDSCANTTIERNAVTDARGYYEFRDVPTGTYLISEKISNGWIPTTPGVYKIYVPSYVTVFRKDFGNIYHP